MNTERKAKLKEAIVALKGGARVSTVSLDDGRMVQLERVRQGIKLRFMESDGTISPSKGDGSIS